MVVDAEWSRSPPEDKLVDADRQNSFFVCVGTGLCLTCEKTGLTATDFCLVKVDVRFFFFLEKITDQCSCVGASLQRHHQKNNAKTCVGTLFREGHDVSV